MRRMLLLGAAVVVLASVAVVAIASDGAGGGTSGPTVPARTVEPPLTGPFAVAAAQGAPDADTAAGAGVGAAEAAADRHRAAHAARERWDRRRGPGLLVERSLTSLAGRLGVDRRHLGFALESVRAGSLAHAVDTGLLSVEERLALEGCMEQRACDPAEARRAVRKLRRGLTPKRLEEYKTAMIKRLAYELGRSPDEVERDLRAQLDETIRRGTRRGRLSRADGAVLTTCLARTARCDLDALRRTAGRLRGAAR